LQLLNPSVSKWFSKFQELTPPQKFGIKLIHERKNCLITAPTGSGKTLTAFLSIISELENLAEKNELEDRIYCVYISPLKALANDIQRNLQEPLQDVRKLIEEKSGKSKKGDAVPEIRVGIRSGDTPQSERSKMLRKPPHILITTPESLAIMISSEKFSLHLKKVEWVIIDEIHELCNSKRGVHLSLSLERMQEASSLEKDFCRVGLSATVAPLEEVAKFLVGLKNGKERDCSIVNAQFAKKIKLSLYSPLPDLVYATQESLSNAVYRKAAELIESRRTTLVFTNTRSGTERVVHQLKKLLPKERVDDVEAHHSSLSREERLLVEEKLKRGELKAVVCSTSLELGIDIGFIDLVLQLGSPKSVARCLQRTGRSGHRLHEESESMLVGMDRDDLVEIAVMLKEAREGKIDRVKIPENCLDVLTQHVLGMAIDRDWTVQEGFELVRRSYCYRDLPESDFLSILRYLSGAFTQLERHHVYGRIWFDEREKKFGRKGKLVRVIYSMNSGTIPDEVAVSVILLPYRKHVGMLEEEFLEKLKKGDRFVLGGKVYEFSYAMGLNCYVTSSAGLQPTIPSWFSEMLPLSWDLANSIADFRKTVFDCLGDRKLLKDYLKNVCHCDDYASDSIIDYFQLQFDFLKKAKAKQLHSRKHILVEEWSDETNRTRYFIVHSLVGRKANGVLAKTLGFLLSEETGSNVLVALSDNGFALGIPARFKVEFKEIFESLDSENVEGVAKNAILKTEAMKRRFRHVATRSFMILRNYMGRRKSVGKQQMSAHMLLGMSTRIEGFPVVKETFREILEDDMDLEKAKEFLDDLNGGKRALEFLKPSKVPSPFAHNLVTQGYSDAVMIQDRKKILQKLHEMVLDEISDGVLWK
jgi:ATP-dependent Lhr-like helicase